MDRRFLAVLALVFVFSSAFALTLDVKTVPAVITPGTSGKIIFEITATGGARHIYMRVGPIDVMSIEDEDTRIDIGDVMAGTVSYSLWFSVPSSVKPGVYVLPVTIEYTDPTTGNSYEEHFSPLITITSGKGIDVKMATDRVYGERDATVKFTVSNSGEPAYNVRMTVPVAIGDPVVYVGDLGSGESKEVHVKILPNCNGGVYTIPIILTGFRGAEAFTEELNYTVKCIPPKEDLRLAFHVPQEVNGGEQNTVLTIRNITSVALGPISVQISGINVKIGGQTAYYVNTIPPQGEIRIPVVWKLEKADEQGTIQIIVTTPSGQRTYSYSVMPTAVPEIRVYPGSVKWAGDKLDVTLMVANVGTGTAETVFVYAEGNAEGQAVIGDLSPGDYDSADVYATPSGNTAEFSVKVEYVVDGERHTVTETIRVPVPGKDQGILPWVIGMVVVAAAIWWWRKRK